MKKSAANEPEDQFAQGFSRKLKHHEAAPAADLWSRIELTLDKDEALVYKKRWKLYSQLAAAVLALLMVTGGAFYYNNFSQTKPEIAVVDQQNIVNSREIGNEENETANTANPNQSNQPTQSGAANTQSENALEAGSSDAIANNKDGVSGNKVNLATNKNLAETGKNTTANQIESTAAAKGKTNNPEVLIAGSTVKNETEAVKTVSEKPENAVESINPASASKNRITRSSKGKKTAAVLMAAANGISKTNKATSATEVSGTTANPATSNPTTANPAAHATGTTKTGSPANAEGNHMTGETSVAKNAGSIAAPNMAVETANAGTAKNQTAGNSEMELLALRSVSVETVPDTSKNALKVLPEMPDAGILNHTLPQEDGLSKWSIGASYTAQQFKQNVAIALNSSEGGGTGKAPFITQDTEGLKAAEKEYNANTRSAYSWQAQIHAGYQIFPKWQLQTGLLYIKNQAQTETSYLVHLPGAANTTNTSPLIVNTLSASGSEEIATIQKTESFTTMYRYEYIGIPIALQFQPRISNKFQGFFSMGCNVNRLIQNSVSSSKAGVQELRYEAGDSDSPYRDWQVSVTGAAGFSIFLTPQLRFLTGLEANYYVEPLVDQSKLPVRADLPYTLGLKMGLSFTFNKAAAAAR